MDKTEGHPALGERWLEEDSKERLLRLAEELLIPNADNMSRDELIHSIYSARRSRATSDSHNARE